MAQTSAQINNTIKEKEAKTGVRWLQEICDKLHEKGLEGHGMDSELWWLRKEDFNGVK